jgi:exosortase/archaeosortase family protein
MKTTAPQASRVLSFLRDRINVFYFLAFIPFFLILYYNAWVLIIAFYGFFFLLLKDQKLRSAKEPKRLQKILGLIVAIGSFFTYYALILVIPRVAFYGGANYIVFLFGLFLVFFDSSALKEAFTPIFFIATATSSSLVAAWLKPYFSPYLSPMAYQIVNILNVLGVHASLYDSGSAPILSFSSLSGSLVLASFVYECIGVYSALVFSIVLVIVLFEDPSGLKVRLSACVIGVLGTFVLNIVRITVIFLTDFFYGAEAGATVHYVIGYALFSAWLVFFLYVYYKRKNIRVKIQSLWRKSSLPKTQFNK